MSFEDLEAWQMARQLVNSLYALARVKGLSKDFRLCSQVQAAGVSIMSNIAEGFERTHLQEKIQFYNIARGSAGEVRSLLYVVSDNFADVSADAERLREQAKTVGKLITGLLNSTVRRRGIVLRAVFILLSPIFYLLTSLFVHAQ
jgi:four helix bundle protein